TNLWWSLFEQADEAGKVRDYDYLLESILNESGLVLPRLELLSAKLRIGLKLINSVRKIRGKSSIMAAQVLMHDYIIPWLSRGYRIYKENKT
ncbi:MAG: hypothetical protein ACFFDQ_08495, partial [Candidatus Thorarchaeota archaeon]